MDAQMNPQQRRYDLDWLRVLAFGLLILYHVGMYYVADWEWHIKSPVTSSLLQNLMMLTNPWRMSLLFFVSGAALFYASRKITPSALLRLRNRRLLLPLVFAMAVIVPPQVYVELVTSAGMEPGYWSFYGIYLDARTSAYPDHQHSPLGLWTWNHLWFLAYLWVYTLVFVTVKPLLDRAAARLVHARLTGWSLLLLPIFLLTGYRMALLPGFPPSNALFDDWYNHARYFSFMAGGYVLAQCPGFWQPLASRWKLLLAAAGTSYFVILGIVHGQFQAATGFLGETGQTFAIRVLASCNQWFWILALLGIGHRFLNRRSAVLNYMNEAILPWYILHQTLIVLLAYWLSPAALPVGLEASILIAGALAGCALGYEGVKRIGFGRLLFGLKPMTSATSPPTPPAVSGLASAIRPGL